MKIKRQDAAWPALAVLIPALLATYSFLAWLSRAAAEHKLAWFLGGLSIAFLCLLLMFRVASRISAAAVLLVAIAIHSIGLLGAPLFEDDHYRYLWDGYRLVQSGSPYGVAPSEFFGDETLARPMKRILDGINYPDIPTIYAPVLQYVFGLGSLISPGELWPIKSMLSLANLALIALLLRTAHPRMVLLYAWNPLVFKEVALTGHPDALLALPLLLAWHFRSVRGPWLKGFLFGIALAVKVSALPALAWLLWQKRYWAIPIAVLALFCAYLPFAGQASDLPGLLAFAGGWEFNAGPYAWLRDAIGAAAAKFLCMAIAAIAMFSIQYRARASDGCPPWHRVFGVMLLFSPVVNPWYLLWLLPFASYSRDLWPWAAAAAVCLSYATGLNAGRDDIGAFALLPWAGALEWSMITAALCIDTAKRFCTLPAIAGGPNGPYAITGNPSRKGIST